MTTFVHVRVVDHAHAHRVADAELDAPASAAEAIDREGRLQGTHRLDRRRTAGFKVARTVEFREELPPTATGKVLEDRL